MIVAWEKRGTASYYYRSVREGGRVRRRYAGTGLVGRFAAASDALRRQRRRDDAGASRAAPGRPEAATALSRDLGQLCDRLAAAALYAAGYHRPSRHAWRIWRHGRRVLRVAR